MGANDPAYQPKHLAIEDDPKRPYKAYATAASTAIGAFVMSWILDSPPFTPKEMAGAALGALAFAGVGGFTTFKVPNPKIRAKAKTP